MPTTGQLTFCNKILGNQRGPVGYYCTSPKNRHVSMKNITVALLTATLIGGSMLATSADARGGGHRYHGHNYHRSHVGIFVGAPLFFAPFYYPRYYYYPPAVAVPGVASAPVYIEQPAGEFASPSVTDSGAYWYYCRDSQTYYPYVQQCASAWERVVPNSAPPR